MSIKQPEMVFIPKGYFIMGSIPELGGAFENEAPIHIVYLTNYYLSRTPITNAAYAHFIADTHYVVPEGWRGKNPPYGKEMHPVANVSWKDAMTYCGWLSTIKGQTYRLPSEAEWEKGARGTNARLFSWGNVWEPGRCNTSEAGVNGTVPVDHFQKGESPYGLFDIAGNVFEWTNTLWGMNDDSSDSFRYPYDPDDGREIPSDDERVSHIVRGGSYLRGQRYARNATRVNFRSMTRSPEIGFRIAMDGEL
jgi:formylglycine-generating enzyme required for sulfatase activity